MRRIFENFIRTISCKKIKKKWILVKLIRDWIMKQKGKALYVTVAIRSIFFIVVIVHVHCFLVVFHFHFFSLPHGLRVCLILFFDYIIFAKLYALFGCSHFCCKIKIAADISHSLNLSSIIVLEKLISLNLIFIWIISVLHNLNSFVLTFGFQLNIKIIIYIYLTK